MRITHKPDKCEEDEQTKTEKSFFIKFRLSDKSLDEMLQEFLDVSNVLFKYDTKHISEQVSPSIAIDQRIATDTAYIAVLEQIKATGNQDHLNSLNKTYRRIDKACHSVHEKLMVRCDFLPQIGKSIEVLTL